MSIPRKHHYCPLFYLKYFVDPYKKKDRLHVFDRKELRDRLSNVKNEAHQKDFYKIEAENVDPYFIEKAFGEIEGNTKPAIDQIINEGTFPTDESFDYLINFIAILALRGPAYRNRIANVHEKIIKQVISVYTANEDRWNGLVTNANNNGFQIPTDSYKDIKEFVDEGQFKITQSQEHVMHTLLDSTSTLVEVLAQRNWFIVKAVESATFICSDNPVALTWKSKPSPWFPPGFGLNETQVTLPLSPKIAIVGVYEEAPKHVLELGDIGVATLNYATMANVNRYIYTCNGRIAWRNAEGKVCNKEELIQASLLRNKKEQNGQ